MDVLQEKADASVPDFVLNAPFRDLSDNPQSD
jgi:hypothetical protein